METPPQTGRFFDLSADFYKLRFGCLFLLLGLLLPPISFVVTWIATGELHKAFLAALILFAILFTLTIASFAFVRTMPWFTVPAPFLLGLAYTIAPDLFPFQFDDAAVVAAGALLSYYLAVRRLPGVPVWTLIALLGAAVYTLIGVAIPGPVDEFLVGLIAIGTASTGVIQAALKRLQQQAVGAFTKNKPFPHSTDAAEVIDVESRDLDQKPDVKNPPPLS